MRKSHNGITAQKEARCSIRGTKKKHKNPSKSEQKGRTDRQQKSKKVNSKKWKG